MSENIEERIYHFCVPCSAHMEIQYFEETINMFLTNKKYVTTFHKLFRLLSQKFEDKRKRKQGLTLTELETICKCKAFLTCKLFGCD